MNPNNKDMNGSPKPEDDYDEFLQCITLDPTEYFRPISHLKGELKKATKMMLNARRVVFFTGAGISIESGIPTFRDPMYGVWKNKKKMILFGTPFGWKLMPKKAWKNFKIFLEPITKASPNPGHYAINYISSLPNMEGVIITQNVDRLHQDASTVTHPCPKIYEIHGSVQRIRCIKCGKMIDTTKSIKEIYDMPSSPRCDGYKKGKSNGKKCGGYARPDAVLFGEALPSGAFDGAVHESRNCDVFIAIGTSGVVQPAASLIEIAHRNGAKIIIINPEPNDMDALILKGPSGPILSAIYLMMLEEMDITTRSLDEFF